MYGDPICAYARERCNGFIVRKAGHYVNDEHFRVLMQVIINYCLT